MSRKKQASVQERYISLRRATGPVLSLEQGGSLVFRSVLEIVGRHLDEEREMEIYETYHRLFLSLNFPIQIIVRVRPLDVGAYLQYIEPQATPQDLWEGLAQDHATFLRNITKQRGLLGRRFYIVVSAEEIGGEISRFRMQEKMGYEGISRAAYQLRSRCETVAFHLQSLGISSSLLSGKKLADFYRGFFALGGRINRDIYDRAQMSSEGGLSLQDIVAPQEIVESAEYLRVDNQYVKVLCLDRLPRRVGFGWLKEVIECDEIFDLIHHIVPRSSEGVISHLRRQQTYAVASHLSAKQAGKITDASISLAGDDLQHLVEQVAAGEQAMLESSLHLVVRAGSVEELEQRVRAVVQRVNAVFTSRPRSCSFEQSAAFRKCSPGSMHGREPVLLPSSVLATMIPFMNHFIFRPSPTAVLEGMTAHNEPVILDWWEDLANPNRLIIGPPGYGKSYKAKLDILHLYYVYRLHARRTGQDANNFQILLIDPEREANEYEGGGVSLVDALGGERIRFSPGSAHHLNPFDLPLLSKEDPEEDVLANHIEKLHRLFDLMLAFNVRDKEAMLTPAEQALLDEAISQCYMDAGITADRATHSRPAPLLEHLYIILESEKCGPDVTNLAQRLRRYVFGSLAGLFSRPTNVQLGKNLVQFDVKELGNEQVRAVALMMISSMVWDMAFSSRIPRYLFVDEIATVGRYKAGREFLEEMFQRGRKHYLSVTGMTQHPSSLSESILANCATHVLLHQDHTSIDYVAQLFKLSGRESQRLLSFEPGEALMLLDGKRMTVRFSASEKENSLITTNRREIMAAEAKRRKVESYER